MKFFAPALIFCGASAFAQAPQVPHKMQFAGITLTIRDDARRDIQKDVDALTQSPKYFGIKAERAKTYFPIIEKIFAEERLPDDFKYLALQESALVPDAVSSSNAVGFWQFKDFTAREMGLRVDDEVDERMNIASASRGAARYLKQCNHYFNNWVYALQAYQMGAGGVMRMVGDKDLGTRHMEITSDTYWYVRKFLAHKVAFENNHRGKAAMEVTGMTNTGGRTLHELASELAMDEMKLREFNKWLKSDRVPTDRSYMFLIPKGESTADFGTLTIASATPSRVSATQEPEQQIEINGLATIRARKGETLEAIARRAGVSLSSFLHFNEITMDVPLLSGQLYFLHKKKKKAQEDLYTLKPGDTWWLVSQQFGIQQKFLLRYNGLNDNTKPVAGTTLFLNSRKPSGISAEPTMVATLDEDDSFYWDQPMTKADPPAKKKETGDRAAVETDKKDDSIKATVEANVHEVKPSDTIYSVARQYNVTINELMEWNEKKDFSLAVGEMLRVRKR